MNKIFEELTKWALSALYLALALGIVYGISTLFQNYPMQCIYFIFGLLIVWILRLAFFE